MVTNKSIFHPGNLLLDATNPCDDPQDDVYYSDVNSGTWFTAAKKRMFTSESYTHAFLSLY